MCISTYNKTCSGFSNNNIKLEIQFNPFIQSKFIDISTVCELFDSKKRILKMFSNRTKHEILQMNLQKPILASMVNSSNIFMLIKSATKKGVKQFIVQVINSENRNHGIKNWNRDTITQLKILWNCTRCVFGKARKKA